MNQFLLDTNALSEAIKQTPNLGYMSWLESVDSTSLFTTVLALGEIQKGISRLGNAKRRKTYEQFLENIIVGFNDRILGVDAQTCIRWGNITGEAMAAGKPVPAIDALIAAQCMQHNITLVTRNTKDFERFAGLEVLNPWLV